MPRITNFESAPARWLRKLNNSLAGLVAHTKVLLYHRVTTLSSDPLELSVIPEHFSEQLNALKKKYAFITVDELAASIAERKKIKGRTILVTFDDGYADNLYEALPILETLGIPAVFFITTSQLNTSKELWWDELERLVLKNEELPPELFFNNIIPGKPECILQRTDRDAIFSFLHDELKYSTLEQRELLLEALRSQIPAASPGKSSNRLLTHAELKKLAGSKWATISAHTVNHTSLGMQQAAIQEYELKESKKILETLTGKRVDYISYPYGSSKDFSNTTIELSAKAGFKLSFSNYYGFATRGTSPHKIPRILVRNWKADEMERQINKLY